MSRAAALASRKGAQKVAIAAKREDHAAKLAMGLDKTWAKAIKGDVLLCTVCGATQMGPTTQCHCPGGKSKPDANFDPDALLLAAAKARHALNKDADKKTKLAGQSAIAGGRAKKREEKSQIDHDLELQGDLGNEVHVKAEFPVGKLGCDLEKAAVTKVADDGNAHDLGVKKGWVIASVDDLVVGPETKKAAIGKAFTVGFKAGNPVKVTFRTPIQEGYSYCINCDKFVENAEFTEGVLEKDGPGKAMCAGCEEFQDMGF